MSSIRHYAKTYAIQTVLEIALKVLFLGKKFMTL